METNPDAYRGCLLGLAVGDALGAAVDEKSYSEICDAYGPAGLLGYDLVNSLAEFSSYTQVAAFCANGLLLGIAKGLLGSDGCMRYITLALKEWAHIQHLPRDPQQRRCWLGYLPQLRRRQCMDPRTLDSLTRDVLGTPEAPANSAMGPGSLTAAVPIGLFFHPERMQAQQIGLLGASTVALTHGSPMAFLSGAVLAYVIAGIVQEPQCPMHTQFLQAAEAVSHQFSQYEEAGRLYALVQEAVALADDPTLTRWQTMERLGCDSCDRVLAGAMYAVLAGHEDIDEALIVAVNHSGKSAAVGAVTGAILGAKLGEAALPEFYVECLQGKDVLRELATDLYNACPKGWRTRLFDDEWDRKYTQGKPAHMENQ